MIQAFHSNWTAPFFYLNKDKEYYIEDFELLTTILSALKWREHNGNIKMVTDTIGAEYYRNLGIDKIWNLGIEVSLDYIDEGINSNVFWAAGKIYALRNQEAPSAMIDTDFIVWESIQDVLKSNDLAIIHKEEIIGEVYPYKNYFKMKSEYKFDEQWDWSILPCNTAFTYISNNDFKEYYTKSSIEFMRNLDSGKNKITNMVFAEQRLISMCAKKMNININEMMSLEKLFSREQTLFTHTWGYKNLMKNNFSKRKSFCIKCINRIIKDYPEVEEVIANIKELQYYYNENK